LQQIEELFQGRFDDLPEAERRMHGIEKAQDSVGTARIRGGRNPLSRLVRILARLPVWPVGSFRSYLFHHGPDRGGMDSMGADFRKVALNVGSLRCGQRGGNRSPGHGGSP
jgi:hypothetical protein